jgi:hypothetical protein
MAFFVDKSCLLVIITLEHLTIDKEGFYVQAEETEHQTENEKDEGDVK